MSTATATNPMGLKRICTGCGERFYDLNKRPIKCPTCDVEFTGEVKPKTRRGRSTIAADTMKELAQESAAKKEEGEIQEEDPEVEVISLDDAEKSSQDSTDEVKHDDEDTLDDIPDLNDADADNEIDDNHDDTLLVEDDD